MRIPLTEPQSTRYLAINSKTNRVHLFVPFVAGSDISTDNTCKATLELKTFFESGAIAELESYQSALEFDIALLSTENPLRQAKEERLAQITQYLEAVKAMQNAYRSSISHFLKKPSNLYSIQLRPTEQDSQSWVESPVFTVNRANKNGLALSPLYNNMQARLSDVSISCKTPVQTLVDAAMKSLGKNANFNAVKFILQKTCREKFGIELDFTRLVEDKSGRLDRSFDPLPSFNEETLPRVLTIYNYVTNVKSWFPLAASSSGLGFDFALIRGPRRGVGCGRPCSAGGPTGVRGGRPGRCMIWRRSAILMK